MQQIGKFIEERRKGEKVSKKEMADVMGTSYDTYCRVLRGKGEFTEVELFKAVERFDYKIIVVPKSIWFSEEESRVILEAPLKVVDEKKDVVKVGWRERIKA